jgi:hypothetical protein
MSKVITQIDQYLSKAQVARSNRAGQAKNSLFWSGTKKVSSDFFQIGQSTSEAQSALY